jgi:two-component system, cell cycle response regulator DivK
MISQPPSSVRRPLALIVDQDADTREMYAMHLTAQGISVVEAHDGAEAVAHATSLRPDIITTDLTLRDCSGLGLCAQLKEHDTTKDIPVIAVTGRAMPNEVAYALASGCIAVLVKPCLPDALLSEIRRVLRLQ